jgi:hypothetical protein
MKLLRDIETDDLDQLLADYEQGESGVPNEESPEGDDELDLDLGDDVPSDDDNMGVEFDSSSPPSSGEESPEGDDELDLDLGDEGLGGDEDMDQLAQQATEDPDRAGVIRTVKNSHLVYKRQAEDGTYDELWVYNVKEFDPTLQVKKAILAGTDIPPGKLQSADGKQTYTSWASGNAEMLLIKGLPN